MSPALLVGADEVIEQDAIAAHDPKPSLAWD
jgi:hypothetical protein